jgi:DNA-binding CsgD family transcriptional regulator
MISMDAFSPVDSIVEKRNGSGFLMLSSSLQTLHWDRRAWELCRKICAKPNQKDTTGTLPLAVIELGREILVQLQVRTQAKDWEQFRIRRIVQDEQDAILLSGIGLPDPRGLEECRLLIILEEIGRRQDFTLDHAKQRFNFTERESQVIQHLMKGWTNKEIANAIGISEQTVKEHIKHIMDKTKTSTRTGILVQIFQG